jgi:hypothetical protein
MRKYTNIAVPVEVKQQLKLLKGNKTWGEFLTESCNEYKQLRGRQALKELRQLLSEEDLEAIRQSSKEFREKFVLR